MVIDSSEDDKKKLVITQVSIGGFDERTSAKELTEYLERAVGSIMRCRLKRSLTPPNSYPDYEVDASQVRRTIDVTRVIPHAFVHFAIPKCAKRAQTLSGKCALILDSSPLKVNVGMNSSFRVAWRKTTLPIKFENCKVQIGSLFSWSEFWVGWEGPNLGVDFHVDPYDGTCGVFFTKDITFSIKDSNQKVVIKCDMKLEFPIRDIQWVHFFQEQASLGMLVQLSSSPLIYYRTDNDDTHVTVPFLLLDDEDPWIRTTDFTGNGAVGRCRCYKISFSPRYGLKMEKARDYFRECRILEHGVLQKVLGPQDYPPKVSTEPGFMKPMRNHFFSVNIQEGLSFEMVYLVTCLVHKGIINQHRLCKEFFDLLRSQSPEVNTAALRHMYSCHRPVFDAYKELKTVQEWLLKNPRLVKETHIPEDSVEVRRLMITPTGAQCLPPQVELSNRVLRNYREISDRFIRVTFTDEGLQTLNSGVLSIYTAPIVRDFSHSKTAQKTAIFRRVRSIAFDGFNLCGRRYLFLAFSSNQLRDRSAWFFADTEKTTADSIRSWMGKFTDENVAKCAARMGMCFSSTYATVEFDQKDVNFKLAEIERNGYVFSDGIGKITPELATQVASKLKLSENPPCAYQVRYAGCKGVIVTWPRDGKAKLSIRPSMFKFESKHTMLEVITWTRFQPGYLNRQIITLLSTLKVPNEAFLELQDSMVSDLSQILVNGEVAHKVVTNSCGEQANTAAIMLSAGFTPQTEPHLREMLSCIRAAQLGDLLAKARIFNPDGRWLMGCLDELGELEHGQCFIQVSSPSLENCFIKHGKSFSKRKHNVKVITGTVVVAKNPCLHPGEIRVLEAVDVPGLHHLVDCLVFPQKGDRPHTNEASGSDLDGDTYFVTWNETLVPPSGKSWAAMDYDSGEAKFAPRQVSSQDIIEFFMKHMVSDSIGQISNAHVVHADLSKDGALDENCLYLAELAAIAVDVPKTGKQVFLPNNLKPKMYPDFMEKDGIFSYKSEKILGILYRKIKDSPHIKFEEMEPQSLDDLPYDLDLEVLGSEDFLSEAWHYKCLYDRQIILFLGLYNVSSEGEVVTSCYSSISKHNSRKVGELKEKLNNTYRALNKEFKAIFENVGSDVELSDEEKNAFYERKASAWYQVTYHPKWVKKLEEIRATKGMTEESGRELVTPLSFPWIAVDYLMRIKIKAAKREFDPTKPIDSLACYLLPHI
ncbi:hypothetical protein AMTRI_Chr05g74250 [Amborella trichopoda]